ncbi:MAG: DUF523 and DUF1722 domain-containing protein [Anaerolineae bacterium]|jgi:uncharacterized protein YbgA (DUF1722 family)/uncharacterized protein YbbK (DUF523 family)
MASPFWRECLEQEPTIRLGVSMCLMGENVRYDGGHKRDRYLINTLGEFVQWVPVCPEVEIGLPVPREAMHLVGDPDDPRLVTVKAGNDYTERMQTWARDRLDQLAETKLNGFVFKSRSPSSGLHRVKVYDEQGMPSRVGTGIFPREVMRRFPLLPLEEEGRLHDMGLRENFIERVFVHYRWTCVLEKDRAPGGLVAFHTAHKLTMMAHSPQHYQKMGRLVAQAGNLPWRELVDYYGQLLMDGLQEMATPGRHVNALQHLMGFLKEFVSSEDKAELLGLIEDYRQGLLPLIVPLTLLKHHLNRYPVPEWVHQQVYLNPYPKELMLRNHV